MRTFALSTNQSSHSWAGRLWKHGIQQRRKKVALISFFAAFILWNWPWETALLLWQIRPLWQRHNYLQPVLCSLKMPIEFSGSAVCTYFELKHFTARNVLPFLRSISQPQLCAESCSLQVPSLFLHLDMYAHSSQALVQQFILVMHLMGYKNLILFRSSHLSSRRHDTNS